MSHKLLLADDSITIQRVIELTFADEDVNVAAVGDGQQAIDRIEAEPPDIILADVGMPKRDGYDVAAYVKSRPTLAHIPVVLLTGAFEPVDQARATAVGCDGVLAKPFEPHMVISRVKQLLKGASGTASPRASSTTPAPPPQAAAPPVAADVAAQEVPRPASSTSVDPLSLLKSEDLGTEGKATDSRVSLDDYFDQLDAAFSNLDSSQRAGGASDRTAAAQTVGKPEVDGTSKPALGASDVDKPSGLSRTPGAGPNEFEWIAKHAAELSGVAHLDFSRAADVARKPVEVAAAPAEGVQPSEPAVPVAHRPPPVMQASTAQAPAVVEPVAAPKPKPSFEEPSLTVAELPRPVVSVPVADAFVALLAAEQGEMLAIPGVLAPAPPTGSVPVTDELVERVSERVLNRLNDTAVRETVRDTVSRVAERLVREEIERIKRTGKLGDS
jgi:CheY-like chemotaxis protein